MDPFNLSRVGLTNETYSTGEEALIRQALISARQDPGGRIEEIARYETALAPHKKLNEDVWRYIFTFADLGISVSASHPLMTLSCVCVAWRRIVLNMHHLWANTRLKLVTPPNVDHRIADACLSSPRARFIRLWLDRGGELPRKHLLIFQKSHHGKPIGIVRHLVAPYPFQSLTLWLEHCELALLRDIPTDHMVHLCQLQLFCRASNHDVTWIPLPLPAQMPKLTILRLCTCFEKNLERLVAAVPWHNLTRLDLLFRIPSTTCFNVILRQGMSLRACSLWPASDPAFSGMRNTVVPLILPNARELRLCCDNDTDVHIFDRAVLTPVASIRLINTYGHTGTTSTTHPEHFDLFG